MAALARICRGLFRTRGAIVYTVCAETAAALKAAALHLNLFRDARGLARICCSLFGPRDECCAGRCCGALPGLRYCLEIIEQIGGDLDFSSYEALVILLKLIGQVTIVDGYSEGGLQAVWAQVSEGVDSLEARTV